MKLLNAIYRFINTLAIGLLRKLFARPSFLKIISLGLGQQSTVIYLMSSLGILARADYAIFADTGSESKGTYDHLKWLLKWQKLNNGIPIIVVGKKSLYKDLIHGTNSKGDRFASIPAFTRGADGKPGILKRQCTGEYKIEEVNRSIRKLYKLWIGEKMPSTEIWLGITKEELTRLKYPAYAWQTYYYPFLDIKTGKNKITQLNSGFSFYRNDCIAWLTKNDFPIPPKSACFFCPFQSDDRWRNMKVNRPTEWRKSVKLDKSIRNSTRMGVRQPVFLHRSCKPLDQVDLQENQLELFDCECSGACGV